MVDLRLKTPPHQKMVVNLQISPAPKLCAIPLYGFLFFQFVSKMVCITSEGPDVFYTAVQESQYCNTAEHSLCLLANHSSVLACPRHNISALQLISVHSRIIKSHSSFPVLHLQNLLAGATVAVQQPAKNSSPYQPLPSAYTFKENRALLWHLEFEIACIHLHVENRLKSLFFFLSTFSPGYFWTEMPLTWTQSAGWVFRVLNSSSSGSVG